MILALIIFILIGIYISLTFYIKGYNRFIKTKNIEGFLLSYANIVIGAMGSALSVLSTLGLILKFSI